MLIFFSDGRLGNQIFQYAFLSTIARDNELIVSTEMKQLGKTFDINNKNFKQILQNKYLDFFIRKFIKTYVLNLLAKLKIIGYVRQDRNATSALPTFKTLKGLFPVILVESDFFQSEIFFNANKFDLSIKSKFIQKAKKSLTSIRSDYTKVFVHVRRGDYIFEQYFGDRGIDLPKEYFLNAIEIIKQKVKKPYFVFLSDDPGYCECCFSDMENKYISKNSMEVDLAIMTLCEYGITSNSSFSWWGAYLMENKKEVIYPQYWYGWKSKTESHIGIQPSWGTTIDTFK